jgi:hypothetical protein
MSNIIPMLNIPKSIREDHTNDQKQIHQKEEDDDDLIFGALDDENCSEQKSLSAIERTNKRERTHSSLSTTDDDWENMLPITESHNPINHLPSKYEKTSSEPIIGMSNFHPKHRLHRHSKTHTLLRWKDAVKKVVQLKDPW